MATPIVRQTLGFDEAFGIQPVSPERPVNPRTPNLQDMLDPGWSKPLERFELGNYNSIYPDYGFSLGNLLSMMNKQQELLISILDKVIALLTKKK